MSKNENSRTGITHGDNISIETKDGEVTFCKSDVVHVRQVSNWNEAGNTMRCEIAVAKNGVLFKYLVSGEYRKARKAIYGIEETA
jgi:hypothetical protein